MSTMNIKNCEKCGKIFNYIGRNICPECMEEVEKEFEVVRNYIKKHPGCNLQDVTQNTEVATDKVLSFLREGRITGGLESAELKCSSCGKTIPYGKLCQQCQTDMGKEINRAVSGVKKDSKDSRNKMFTR